MRSSSARSVLVSTALRELMGARYSTGRTGADRRAQKSDGSDRNSRDLPRARELHHRVRNVAPTRAIRPIRPHIVATFVAVAIAAAIGAGCESLSLAPSSPDGAS